MCLVQGCKKYHLLDAQEVGRERKQLLYQLFLPNQKQVSVDGKEDR